MDGTLRLTTLLACCLLALACSSDTEQFSDAGGDGAGRGAGGFDDGDRGEPGDRFEPQNPSAFELSAPAASENFVFVANTTRSTVAKVAASAGAIRIQTIRVGAGPTEVVASPDDDLALVLNEGSDSVTVIDAGPIGTEDEVRTVDVPRGLNRLRIAPGRALAFAWYDNRFAEPADDAGPLSSVAAINLRGDDLVAYQLSVGVNVRDVRFDAEEERVFIVTDDGVSVARLDEINGDSFLPPVRFAGEGESYPLSEAREVLLAPSGERAIVRIGAQASLRVITLATAERVDIALPADASAIRLVPGSSRVLIGVAGEERVATLDLDTFDPTSLMPLTWVLTPGVPVDTSTLLIPFRSSTFLTSRSGSSTTAIRDTPSRWKASARLFVLARRPRCA